MAGEGGPRRRRQPHRRGRKVSNSPRTAPARQRPSPRSSQTSLTNSAVFLLPHSDTTAATLTCLFYHFATHPEVYKKLQQEVDQFFAEAKPDDFEANSLGRLAYLQACIDESLRLFPPVMSGLQRQTPPQGIQAGDTWIPGNTIVMTPTYTLNRGEQNPFHRLANSEPFLVPWVGLFLGGGGEGLGTGDDVGCDGMPLTPHETGRPADVPSW